MKKLLSVALILVLVLSLGATAFAVATDPEGNEYSDVSTATFTVKYTAVSGTQPSETFTFSEFTCTGVTDAAAGVTAANAPKPAKIADLTLDSSTPSGTATISLPAYESVGIYTYTFHQNVSSTAGVTYYKDDAEQTMKLVVSVLQGDDGKVRVAAVHVENGSSDQDKTGEIENSYEAHSLKISKTVSGNQGDKTKEWNFKVTLTAPEGETVRSLVRYGDAAIDPGNGWTTQTVSFVLTHGNYITFENIPVNTTYTIIEEESGQDGYTTTGEVTEAKALTADAEETIANKKNISPETGITLDSLPYIVIAVLVVAAIAVMVIRKRRSDED